jgi:hypothetical protein
MLIGGSTSPMTSASTDSLTVRNRYRGYLVKVPLVERADNNIWQLRLRLYLCQSKRTLHPFLKTKVATHKPGNWERLLVIQDNQPTQYFHSLSLLYALCSLSTADSQELSLNTF